MYRVGSLAPVVAVAGIVGLVGGVFLSRADGQGTGGPVVDLVWDKVTEAVDGSPTVVWGYEVVVSSDVSMVVPVRGDPRVKSKWVDQNGYTGTGVWELMGVRDKPYRVWVVARDLALQDSEYSSPITVTVPSDAVPPLPPGGFRPKAPTNFLLKP